MLLAEPAYAKLNLALDVLGKRPDGYHDLKMIMQTVCLYDDVLLKVNTAKSWSLICRHPDYPEREYPQNADNLAWKAAACFFEAADLKPDSLEILISKRIPMQAGMAGGSADAAAVLRALNRGYGSVFSLKELCHLAEQIGSDVPYCVMGGTALAEGRGEILSPLPALPDVYFAICKPDFSISTPALFSAVDTQVIAQRPDLSAMTQAILMGDSVQIGKGLCNVFQPMVEAEHPQVKQICDCMLQCGACGAQMTGTGSAIFGMFMQQNDAKIACEQLQQHGSEVFLTKPV